MSIGLVLKHTYHETCEICDKVAKVFSIVFKKVIRTFQAMGAARAASHLAQMGQYEAAKSLMLEFGKKK